ncbi:MAG: cytochrome C peroxidase [Bacteroidota bacterium]|nr:cytochrome C peroxidase [Bacteroidota bacterium]
MAYAFYACKKEKEHPGEIIARTLDRQIDSLSILVSSRFIPALKSPKANVKELQRLFLETRLVYKKLEWAAEYFTPDFAHAANGPPVQEAETGSQQVIQPTGLQVMEPLLFPGYGQLHKAELIRQLQLLCRGCADFKAYFKNEPLDDWQVFDAGKLEVFRMLSLGLTGFDDPLSLNSMQECAATLSGLQQVFGYYTQDRNNLIQQISGAMSYLNVHPDFGSFDRAGFILSYGNPITAEITGLQRKLSIPIIKYNRLLNQEAETLFDTGAFNVDAHGPGPNYVLTGSRVLLGKKLFSDTRLSADRSRSCSSCHRPANAFTDGLMKNTVIGGKGLVRRHTPTLLNAALQTEQFDDQRVNTLEEQVAEVMHNKEEMHGSFKLATNRLGRCKDYRQLFVNAYPEKERNPITAFAIQNALASYIRSLSKLNSNFDRYMRGDSSAMNTDAVSGFNLFMGKAKCGTCHYMPLFNGVLPPTYIHTDAEVIGVPESSSARQIDKDPGRYGVQPFAFLKNAFKTPTVRNANRTAPYMHNGVFHTLDELIDFYDKGGGAGRGIKIGNQTLSPEPLKLTIKERKELVTFIKCLDDQ